MATDKYDAADALQEVLNETQVGTLGWTLAASDSEDDGSLILETEQGDFRLRLTKLRGSL